MKAFIKVFFSNHQPDVAPSPDSWIPRVNAVFEEKQLLEFGVALVPSEHPEQDAVMTIKSYNPSVIALVKSTIKKVLTKECDVPDDAFVVSVVPVLEEETEAGTDEPEAEDEESPEEKRRKRIAAERETLSRLFDNLQSRVAMSEPEEDEEDSSHEEPEAVEDPFAKVKEQLDGLVNVDEFRSLCTEIMGVGSSLVRRKAQTVFINQCYLFAIGEGQGLTSCLEILGDTIVAANLVSEKKSKVMECSVPYDEGEKNSIWEGKMDAALHEACRNSNRVVLCFDLSEWTGHMTNAKFREMLINISSDLQFVTVVFRVPYLDKEVLSRVEEALKDVFFLRTVVFPPLSMAHFRSLTEIELRKYGYKVTDAAWTYLEQKLSEEKSDGRFYGINTLHKVISELLYKKELSNLNAKKESSTITKGDAKAICAFPPEVDPDEMLDALVGMEEVKARLKEVVRQIEVARRVPDIETPCIHMRFVGNPGTGKTTIARILGKLLKKKGVLRIGNFFEYSGRDFCGKYIGETAPKTVGLCRDAYGSVLFIDEAYSLYRSVGDSKDYGREALDTLIAEMENHRDDMLIIMAGYPDEMDTMMQGNAGLESRMPYTIKFNNYSREQLFEIFMAMMKKRFDYEPEVETVVRDYFGKLSDEFLSSKEFSNGRFVRNLFERTWAKASLRCELTNGRILIKKEDFLHSIADDEFKKSLLVVKRRFGFGD